MTSSDETHETTALDLIEEQAEASIRRLFHDGRWHFSVIDVIALLTDSAKPGRYWTDMKRRLGCVRKAEIRWDRLGA